MFSEIMSPTFKLCFHCFIGRAISLPFLLLTYWYFLYSTHMGYLYKKIFMNYLESLIAFHIWIVVIYVYSEFKNETPVYTDETFSFWFISNLLWTNVLCFRFWWSIKNLMPRDDKSTASKNTYLKYYTYVLVCSLLFSVACVIYNQQLIAIDSTWTIQRIIIYIIINVFPGLILSSNFLMMTHVTIMIVRKVQQIKKLTGANNIKCVDDYKKKLIICLKLFVIAIMGILFSQYVRVVFFQVIFNAPKVYVDLLFGNSLQGLFIFLMFSLKKRNILKLKKRFFEKCSHENTTSGLNSSENHTHTENCKININEED